MNEQAAHELQPDELLPDELLPEMREFRRRLVQGYAAHPPLDHVNVHSARAIVEAVRAPLARGGPAMAGIEDRLVPVPGQPAVRLRIYRPRVSPGLQPALAYLHGGGWVYFSLNTHDRLMREYAQRAGRVVVGIDYARVPEARFPVAQQQAVAALRWLHDHASEIGVARDALAVAGDSVGANLALSAALALRGGAQPVPLQGLVLNYGTYGDDDSSESFQRYDGALYTLGRDEMRGFWRGYLRSEADRHDPLAQPLRAPLADLAGLPPALLVVGECDVLRDSSLQLAARLQQAGSAHQLRRYAGAPHSFLEAMSFAETSQRALDDSARWLHDLPRAGAA